jgi:hypothetical protein
MMYVVRQLLEECVSIKWVGNYFNMGLDQTIAKRLQARGPLEKMSVLQKLLKSYQAYSS